jgi:Ca-activated chloride channel family protein
VAFDSEVRVLLPGRAMDAEGKAAADLALAALRGGGSTNLSGGWIQGVDCVATLATRLPVGSNFVVLLTDGHANAGIVDPHELGLLADSYRRRGINTSAVGVGEGWSSAQIDAIAGTGGGRLYHAETAEEIATHVLGEFEEISTVVAEDVTLEVEFPSELKVFEHVGLFAHRREGNRLECSLGSLTASSTPAAVFRSTTPAGVPGERLAFTVRARYRTPGDPVPLTAEAATAELVFARAADNDAAPYDPAAAEKAAKAWQAVAVRDAVRLNRERRYAEARAVLTKALERLGKFVKEKWKLPECEPLLAEMRDLRRHIDREMDEGDRKRIATAKWKGTRGERDTRQARDTRR